MLVLLGGVLLGGAQLGCTHLGLDIFFRGDIEMRVAVDAGLNDLSPVAVEVLVVYDKKLLATLETMTAQTWFAEREGLLQQYQQVEHALDAWMWEWVPGQVVPEQVRRFKAGARGGLIFANYFSPGDHRASFDPFEPFLLNLQPSGFTVERID